ncbi:MAG: hypothetical protein GEU81_07175 [Nitriliruptorales bacterium]|nr:hypothetical protein [Nitriliruptorales bacterium]
MTTGGGIFLAAVGAILLFAVDYTLAGIDINVIGVILIVAGIAIVAFSLMNRRRVVRTERPVGEVRRERVIERDTEL